MQGMQCTNFHVHTHALNLKGFTQIVPLPETKHFQVYSLKKMGVKLGRRLGGFLNGLFSEFFGGWIPSNRTNRPFRPPRTSEDSEELEAAASARPTWNAAEAARWQVANTSFQVGKGCWAKCLDDWIRIRFFYSWLRREVLKRG